MRLSVRALITLTAVLAAPCAAVAHGDGQPWLLVPADHVEQGEAFTVIGADMGPQVHVTLEVAAAGSVRPLGSAQTDDDGHFEASFVLPPGTPDGYVELRATDSAGIDAATWLLVGDGTGASAGPPPAAGSPPPGGGAWWADPSLIVLGLLLGGAAIALLVMLSRSRSRTPGSASVPADATHPRPVARKAAHRKSRRAH